jgi:hypothetical protein
MSIRTAAIPGLCGAGAASTAFARGDVRVSGSPAAMRWGDRQRACQHTNNNGHLCS